MKGDHGSSIFNRQVVYYLNLLTFSRKRVTGRINGYPFPPFQPSWAEPPSLPPGVRAPPHANHGSEASLREIVLQPLNSRSEAADWARGCCGDHFGLFGASVRGRAALRWRPAQVDRRAPKERFYGSSQENQGGPVQPRRTMAGRYGA